MNIIRVYVAHFEFHLSARASDLHSQHSHFPDDFSFIFQLFIAFSFVEESVLLVLICFLIFLPVTASIYCFSSSLPTCSHFCLLSCFLCKLFLYLSFTFFSGIAFIHPRSLLSYSVWFSCLHSYHGPLSIVFL